MRDDGRDVTGVLVVGYRYRTQLCNEPASCRRKVCFFAHTVEELREPTTGMEQVLNWIRDSSVEGFCEGESISVSVEEQRIALREAFLAPDLFPVYRLNRFQTVEVIAMIWLKV